MKYTCNETPYKEVTYNIDVNYFKDIIDFIAREIKTYNEYESSFYNVFMTKEISSFLIKNYFNIFNNFKESSIEEREAFLLDLFDIYKQKGIVCDFIEEWFFGKE